MILLFSLAKNNEVATLQSEKLGNLTHHRQPGDATTGFPQSHCARGNAKASCQFSLGHATVPLPKLSQGYWSFQRRHPLLLTPACVLFASPS